MKRVNEYQFYRLAVSLRPLSLLEQGANLQINAWDLHVARVWLQYLLGGTLVDLVVSLAAIRSLLEAINRIIPEKPSDIPSIDPAQQMTAPEVYQITSALQEFETVFSAEVATLDTYIVSKKGIYSTADLVERAEMAIDEDARANIPPEARKDWQQAGRCLAFELPTAVGFHTMRATESVLREYWTLVKHAPAGTKAPEMAQCINELRAGGEDPKLMDILDHIRDLHRNTIMHPEAFLTMKEALRLFDISKSGISAMGDRIGALRRAAPLGVGRAAVAAQAAGGG